MENKSLLRTKMLAARKGIQASERSAASQQAAKLFMSHSIFKTSQHIACYLASADEFDCTPLIEAIWQAKKSCYLPVLDAEKKLKFVLYKKNDPLHCNKHRILEPKHCSHSFPPEQLDLVIAPLVAFDKKGQRLGMGGGYYDKTFEFLLLKKCSKPKIFGLAYDVQEAIEIPHDNWDVNLDGVITESRVF